MDDLKSAGGELRELALFAGAGGGILGGKLLGWRTVCAVEKEEYARSVLVRRQNDGHLEPFPIWDDVCTFDGRPWRGCVDVVSGGFPCQDISAAGKGAGIDGSRSGLWGEMARIVGEVRPRFVFVENSPLLVSRGLAVVLSDLAEMGFDARWGIVGADDAGAPHRRKRIWILAYAEGEGLESFQSQSPTEPKEKAGIGLSTAVAGQDVAHADLHGLPESPQRRGAEEAVPKTQEGKNRTQHFEGAGGLPTSIENVDDTERIGCKKRWNNHGEDDGYELSAAGQDSEEVAHSNSEWESQQERSQPDQRERTSNRCERIGWWSRDPADEAWATESPVGRMAHGVANRVDRIKALGNAQVPAVAALAWKTLWGLQ